MSRPSSSVPNQCAPLGGCSREGRSMLLGFCGAIHGANSANTMNTATSTMPIDASTLRRPSVAAVFQVVEAIGSDHKRRRSFSRSPERSERSLQQFRRALANVEKQQLLDIHPDGSGQKEKFAPACRRFLWNRGSSLRSEAKKLRSDCLPHQLFQRTNEGLILFRRSDAHSYRIRRAPRHQ